MGTQTHHVFLLDIQTHTQALKLTAEQDYSTLSKLVSLSIWPMNTS